MPENHEVPASGAETGTPGSQPAAADAIVNHPDDNDVAPAAQRVLRNFPPAWLTEEENRRREEMRKAALAYQNRGWRVIPVRWADDEGMCSCAAGIRCGSPGKHPVHAKWPEVASAEFNVVADWWAPAPETPGIPSDWHPRANVGIVTGAVSGIFVLDVDPGHDGEVTLASYARQHGEMPSTRVHQTGGGGIHYFFAHPGFDVRNSAGKVLGPGLDIRGDNGFVVAPPSWSAKGQYTVNPAHEIAVAPAPEWLLVLLREQDRSQRGEVVFGREPLAGTGYGRRYAEAALRAEEDRLRHAPSGSRNDTLNEAAFSLGTLGGAGLMEEGEAWAALSEAASAAGLGQEETRKTFLSGWRSGLENPRQVQWRALQGSWPMRDRTEFGLADRMADHYADQLRWCPEHGTWMVYSGGFWERSFKDTGHSAAQQLIRRLHETEALEYDDEHALDGTGARQPSPRDDFLAWVATQRRRTSVAAAADLARGMPLMIIRERTFDLDPMMLNTRNGIVDLESGQVSPHSPEQRMTMQCPVVYDPSARAPLFHQFLDRVQPDPEMRLWLQRMAGYTAGGKTGEQAIFFHHGKGSNGKSVFHEVMMAVFGTYGQAVPVETLLASRMEGRIPNDVARMKGRRYLQASETKVGRHLDEQMIKQLTGGDTISARFLRAEYFDFRPVGKIHLITNHLPAASDDDATWRRVHLLRWDQVIPKEDRDLTLAERIIASELPGVLAWIVRGSIQWAQDGLATPERAHQHKEDYRQGEDILGMFLEECLKEVPYKKGRIGSSSQEIYVTAKNWYTSNGHQAMSQKSFTGRLRDRGHDYYVGGGWRGLPTLQIKFGEGNEDS
jgi:putative DNA primase/helicase